ncbi:MAG: LacI family DNA-binding transcriptional regulator [Caldilineaceae bacterium]|nr:LacI family DNA-binding transcriptional regulator [Caldilineaceae bacterium]
MARPTIEDVARAAQVSKSTVSRVLNDSSEYMREATRTHVLTVIRELGYRPSRVARSLTLKRTQTIGLLISDVSNPFYADVILGVESVALAHDFDSFLCNTMYDPHRGSRFARSLVDMQVDGVLVMTTSLSDDFANELARHQIPLVTLDWVPAVEGKVSVVISDFETGIQAAVAHLVALGHQHFAHIGGPPHIRTSRRKREAFVQALQAHGFDPAAVVVIDGNMNFDSGKAALPQLLQSQQRPMAIFAADDLTAMGLIDEARKAGLQVPGDLSVVGFGNVPLAAQVSPSLTTIALPRYEIGSLMMTILLDFLHSPPVEPSSLPPVRRVGTQLVIRESTAPAAG